MEELLVVVFNQLFQIFAHVSAPNYSKYYKYVEQTYFVCIQVTLRNRSANKEFGSIPLGMKQ